MKIQYLFLSLLLLSSCSSDIERSVDSHSTIEKIHVNLEDFKNEEGSRTNITTDASGVHYVWTKTDTIGIFPSEGKQVEFPMSEGAGSQSATFSGGGWGLKQSSTYAAYCPLIGQYYLDRTQIPVSYAGQVQNGNNNTAHLGKYDYLAAPASSVVNGAVSFNFKRLGCVAMLEIPFTEPGELSSITLSCDQPIFVEQGTYNLASQSPQITSEKLSKTFQIELKDFTTTDNLTATVYFMTPPLQMIGKQVKARITYNGVEHTGTVQSKDMSVGTAYKLPVALENQKPIQNTYHVATAGTLPQLIGEENKFKITELKLTGELNGSDIRFLREMAGSDVNGNATIGLLSYLDLYNAKIVEGGDHYNQYRKEDYFTNNNIMGSYMFYKCSSLQNIILPNSVTSIGNATFKNCNGLTGITIPNSVTSIGFDAFYSCSGLTSITIPNSVTSIGGSAFYHCSGLTSITIPNSVTSIGLTTFSGCSGLTSITIPNSVTSIGNWAFSSCSELTSITIPNSVTSIGDGAFWRCRNLTSITIPNSVTSIGDDAFYDCRGLTSIVIEKGMKILGESLLYKIYYCEKIYLPSTLLQIKGWALPINVSSIYCFAVEAPTLYPNNITNKDCKIYVPKVSVEKYKAAEGWKDFATNIFEMPEGVTEPQ